MLNNAQPTVAQSMSAARAICQVTPDTRYQGAARGHEDERRKENTDGGNERAGGSAEQIAYEGRRRKDGTGRNVPDCHGVEQLSLRQLVRARDQTVPQECKEEVAAAVQNGPDLGEEKEKRPKAEAGGCRRSRCETSTGSGDLYAPCTSAS